MQYSTYLFCGGQNECFFQKCVDNTDSVTSTYAQINYIPIENLKKQFDIKFFKTYMDLLGARGSLARLVRFFFMPSTLELKVIISVLNLLRSSSAI